MTDHRARGGSKRVWAAVVTGILPLLTLAGPLRAIPAAAAPNDGGTLNFLDQMPWLQGPGLYNFRLDLAGVPPTDQLQVAVFKLVRTRTDFNNDAAGEVNDRTFFNQTVPVTALSPATPLAGFDVELPINEQAPAGDPFGPEVPIGETGVFPVQFQLRDADGLAQGAPITTFIVYALQTSSLGQISPLSATLVIPVSSAPVVAADGRLAPPSDAESSRLSGLGSALNADQSVKASILASPVTLDELATGTSNTDQSALANLGSATLGGPFDVLPSTYSPLSLGDLQAVLPDQVEAQLNAGAKTLKSVFQVAPDSSTWVVNGALDPGTLGVLISHHASEMIVPDSDLTPYASEITFAGATYLNFEGTQIKVIAADPGLTADFTRNEPPRLAAYKLLAELAMIYSEAPYASAPRGLAVMPPPDWSVSPDFVATLLNGLRADPLVSAVTAPELFDAVGTPQATRSLAGTGASGAGFSADPGSIVTALSEIKDLASVLGNTAQIAVLDQQVLLAESEIITDSLRRLIFRSIADATNVVNHAVLLPPGSSITLTSTQGQVPITILTVGNLHPRIRLELRSKNLIFRPFTPRGGTCEVVAEAREVCTLSLVTQNTTLNVPVETRSSGVFPLEVSLFTPAGTVPLVQRQNTVRSTAVSGAALIIIIVGLLGLVLWWGRDLRRGRRPKGMVPAPEPDTAGDREIEDFFDAPPPDLRNGSMSPSEDDLGPSGTTGTYG